jgi:hypothetical protein
MNKQAGSLGSAGKAGSHTTTDRIASPSGWLNVFPTSSREIRREIGLDKSSRPAPAS